METKDRVNELIPQNKQQFCEGILKELDSWKNISIKNDSEMQIAIHCRNNINKMYNLAEQDKKETTKPYKDKSKVIDKYYREIADKVKNGLKVITKALGEYDIKKQREINEKQKKLDEIARLKREKEQKRIDAENAKIEKYTKEGREGLAKKAEIRKSCHEDIQNSVVPQVVEKPKFKGASFEKYWEATVTDKIKLIHSLVNLQMFELISVNVKELEREYKRKPYLSINGVGFTQKSRPKSRY